MMLLMSSHLNPILPSGDSPPKGSLENLQVLGMFGIIGHTMQKKNMGGNRFGVFVFELVRFLVSKVEGKTMSRHLLLGFMVYGSMFTPC